MNRNNFCIIMAGGFGSRFWPLCDTANPKQFIDILGNGQSMLQNTFHRYAQVCPRENIIIVTAEGYGKRVHDQIPDLQRYQVLEEPMRRNTAPCVAWAASVIEGINPNANIIVTPSDHAIFGDRMFQEKMNKAVDAVNRFDWIVTVGVRPTNPNTKYGYIQFAESPSCQDMPDLHKVITFTEKPPIEMARQFIQTGEFFWNAGIFVWRLEVMREAFKCYLPSVYESMHNLGADPDREQLLQCYTRLDNISIDYGIIEKADNVHVLEADFGWSDVETWELLYNASIKDPDGNAIVSGDVMTYDVKNCVVNAPGVKQTLVLQGLDGYIVTASKDVLMVCRRDQQSDITRFATDYELRKHRKQY
ncbi:MAG: mannose-1-phosphate guanylyltransferase [Bacteroidales bacterium]|nr:mannose-1-phosphate guanylyltransferase [Bacteroidales bacterium]